MSREGAGLVGLHAIEEGAGRVGAIGVQVGQRRRRARGVPLLARRDAGMAADAHVEVDDQRQLLGEGFAPPLWRRARARGCLAASGDGCAAAPSRSFSHWIICGARRSRSARSRPRPQAGRRRHGGDLRKALRRFIRSAGRMRTRTSYQPAWPVIGSELLMRQPLPPATAAPR